MRYRASVIALLTALTVSVPAHANEDVQSGICDDDVAKGWNFYCSEPEPEPEEVEPPAPVAPEIVVLSPAPAPVVEAVPEPEPEPTATERLAGIRAEMEEVMAAAILDPTEENMFAFLKAQINVMRISGRFADQADRVRFQNPSIDRNVTHPMSQVASHIRTEARRDMEERAFVEAVEDYGLIFVFEDEAACLYCAQQAQILLLLKDQLGVEILAVSRDGSALPDEADGLLQVTDSGQLAALGLEEEPVPLIALARPRDNATEIIGAGLLTADVIVRRTAIVTKLDLGVRYGGSQILR